MRLAKVAVVVLVLVAAVAAVRASGLGELLSPENLGLLREYVGGFGALAPLAYVLAYAAATVFFLPATPLTLLAGLAFGPAWGSLYAFLGATAGLTLSFLIARYAARRSVASWVEGDERLRRIDDGVERRAWRMLVVTRLVPLFPFNLQNYAYGLTRVGFGTYVGVSAACILPGVLVYALAGGLIAVAGESPTTTYVLLGAAGVLFVALFFVPGWLGGRAKARDDETEQDAD